MIAVNGSAQLDLEGAEIQRIVVWPVPVVDPDLSRNAPCPDWIAEVLGTRLGHAEVWQLTAGLSAWRRQVADAKRRLAWILTDLVGCIPI